MNLEGLPWIILFSPLLSAVIITLFTLKQPRVSAKISIAAVIVSFAASLAAYISFTHLQLAPTDSITSEINWLSVGDFKVSLSLRLDGLSLLMLLIVTGVGGLIHIYSHGYMREDPSFSRYFASLSLFTFSMLGIVLAGNFVMMFIFWELVGVSSYLLIGFWHERPAAADACKKAFITNRLGDFGFLTGIIMIWAMLGHLDFDMVRARLVANPGALGVWATIASLLIFCGAMGKSAQFPLHVWLPDAMEGPTPVSAFIHAATMVAAGVYLLCRVSFLFAATPAWPEALAMLNGITALNVIAWIGGFTALLAALIAVQQNDIKRILAYSTLSQLGYMVMAVGLAGPAPAMYHLTTHAFFKALLFLGAGSVIHALHHEQDIWKMGALKNKMPVTFWTFLIGTLALCGVPPLSGFFSKDQILAQAHEHSMPLFILAAFVAMLTTFYMFRLIFVAFFGPAKSQAYDHAHESPKVMIFPLILLAIPSALAGFWAIDDSYGKFFGVPHEEFSQLIAGVSLGAVAVGLTLAFLCYWKAVSDPLPAKLGLLARAMRNRFGFDELYTGIIALTQGAMATVADWLDRWIISGFAIKGLHGTTELIGRALRLLQTGSVQTYAFVFVAGVAVLIYFMLR